MCACEISGRDCVTSEQNTVSEKEEHLILPVQASYATLCFHEPIYVLNSNFLGRLRGPDTALCSSGL